MSEFRSVVSGVRVRCEGLLIGAAVPCRAAPKKMVIWAKGRGPTNFTGSNTESEGKRPGGLAVRAGKVVGDEQG